MPPYRDSKKGGAERRPVYGGRLREGGSLTRRPLTSDKCSPAHRRALI